MKQFNLTIRTITVKEYVIPIPAESAFRAARRASEFILESNVGKYGDSAIVEPERVTDIRIEEDTSRPAGPPEPAEPPARPVPRTDG